MHNSDNLKNAVLEYYRFARRYYLCATEVRFRHHVADILVMNEKEIIDIEIKVSYTDFLADFKKRKHKKIQEQYSYLYSNKLYYCVPANIKEQCLLYLTTNNKPYGLLSYSYGKIAVIKQSKKINDLPKSVVAGIKHKIILRLSSEMVFLRKHKKCDNCGYVNKPDLSGKVFV